MCALSYFPPSNLTGMILILELFAVTFSITGQSTALIVLSQLDSRYFRDIAGRSSWTMDFALVREGEKEPLAESLHSDFYLRSVNLEIELEAGNYIVYVCFAKYLGFCSLLTYPKVRLDRTLDRNAVRFRPLY